MKIRIVSICVSFFISSVLFAVELEELKVDITPPIEKGCKRVTPKEGNWGTLDCSSISVEEKFNCEQLTNAPNKLGGLSPSLPIIECWIRPGGDVGAKQGLKSFGCLLPRWIQYLVYANGEFQKIDTREAFISIFAPVSSI